MSGRFPSPHLLGALALLLAAACGEAEKEPQVSSPKDPAIVEFKASPGSAVAGEAIELSWIVEDAESLRLLDGDAEVPLPAESLPSGSVEVRPDTSRVYTLEARRGDAVAEAKVEVEIAPLPSAELLASAAVVDFGGSATLTWSAPGETSVRIAAGDAVLVEAGDPSGSIEVTPERETTYQLSNADGGVLASVTVRVRPVIEEFEPVTGGPTMAGSPVEVRWRIRGAEAVVVSNLGGATWIAPAEEREEGSTTLPADEAGVFRIEATLESETVWSETGVGILREPAVRSLEVTPSRVTLPPGGTARVRVAWVTADASSIRLVADPGGPVGVAGIPADEGSIEVTIEGTTRFELEAANALGSATATAEVIAFGAESIVSFEADRDEVAPGETVILSWRTTGGASLSVRGPGGALPGCDTGDPAAIREGGCTVTAPATDGRHAFELILADGAGTEAIREATVTVRSGPRILSFATSAERGCGGDEITLSWSVTRDTAGAAPTLRLEDDAGTAYSLDGLDPMEGEITIGLQGDGARSFHLFAASPGHDEAERSVDVEVFAVPEVSLEAGAATYDPGALEPLELSWTASAAGEMLVVADADGGSALPIYIASAAELAAGAGSLRFSPTRPTTFRAIARSPGGCEASDEVSVSIAALEILDFTATPDEILAGEFSTLSWSVAGAERVEVSGVPAWERIWEPFIDISQSPTALAVPPDDCDAGWLDDGCALVTFPNFVFPFDGVERTEARIYVNGLISFDTSRTGPNMNNFDIPSPTGAWAHLAPFWDDLGYLSYDVMYDVGSDDRGRFLVVQWLWANYSVDSNLEFEVILRESGEFEFRYGDMSDDLDYERAIGRKAVIGYQNGSGTDGALISTWEPVWDLPYSGFAFRAPQPGGYGSALVQPWATEEFVLTAHGYDGSEATASATVTVHPRPDLTAVVTRQDVELGDAYELRWSASGITGLVISDDDGPVHVAGAGELAGGSLPLVAGALGTRTFTLVATGALGSTADATAQVTVWVPFDLDSFEVTPAEIAPGELATVSWASHGAETLDLRVDGAQLPTTGMDPDADAVMVGPDYTSTYEITIARADGRSRTMSRKLRVVRASLDGASVPASTRIALGGTVPVSWSASSPVGDPVNAVVFPAAMRELDPQDAPFEDISVTGAELTDLVDVWGVRQVVQLPAGFVFPFLGEGRTALQVGSSGYLGFDPTSAQHPDWRTEMPAGRNGVHLAAFWDDLRGYANGRVYVEHVVDTAGERFVVQWSHFEYVEWPSGPGADLNFQVVLFPDGSFEYRYGAMVSASWQGRADGEAAIIGYQDASGRFGYTLLDRAPMAGGLSNRTWRFDGSHPAAGTAPASPGRDGRIRVCAVVFGDLDCQVLEVDVVSPGDLAITELQLAPAGGLLRQWFEIRNTSPRPILLDGMEIRAGAKSHIIAPASPLVLAPGDYATLAASATPGFTPDYVYGIAVDLDPVAGGLEVELDGLRIAAVEWDATWPVSADVALEVDGFALRPVDLRRTFSDASAWCPATQAYDGTSLGTPGFGGEGCLSAVYRADHFSDAPFIDVSATGTPVPGTTGAWVGARVPGGLPFSFPFYGAGDRTDLWVGSTGEVGFAGICDPIYGCGVDLEEGGVFAFRDMLQAQPGSSVRSEVRTIGGRQVAIVQWTGFGLPGSEGSLTLQVQLWEGGELVIAYAELEGDPAYQGGRAFVGLQSTGFMNQLLYSDTAPVLWPGQSIRYRHR